MFGLTTSPIVFRIRTARIRMNLHASKIVKKKNGFLDGLRNDKHSDSVEHVIFRLQFCSRL